MKRLGLFVATFGIMLGVLIFANRKSEQPGPIQKPPSIQQPGPGPVQPLTFEQAKASITQDDIRKHLYYLCSKELEGRMSGMEGNRTAAKYLIQWMQAHGIEPGAGGTYLQHFPVSRVNEFREKSTGQSANVIGILPGNDPVLKNEYIVIGAHMDHIGYGPSMSMSPTRREVHPGADDNASGTCVVMACVRAFGSLKGQNKRTIVFMHFSGEEMGLIGAKHYCDNPIYPLKQTFVMVNQDMVGRLRGQTTLTAAGANANPAIAQVVNGINGYPFKLRPTGGTGGGSDHAAFAAKGVPVIMFHTGQHAQYHTPDDTADLIDLQGLHQISQAVFELCWKIDKIPSRAVQVHYGHISFDHHKE